MISFFRTILTYIIVVISMRCMGKRQIGQLQPYEVVIALMIADLAALPMEDSSVPLLNGVIPILSLVFVQIILSYLIFKNGRIRSLFCGKSKVVVRDGIIQEKVLSGEMYTVSDLAEALRLKGFSDISMVKEARLETNGELSVIPTGAQSPLVREDLKIEGEEPLVTDVVICGKVIEDNLSVIKVDGGDILREVRKAGGRSLQDILYAGVKSDGSFVLQLKGDTDGGKR